MSKDISRALCAALASLAGVPTKVPSNPSIDLGKMHAIAAEFGNTLEARHLRAHLGDGEPLGIARSLEPSTRPSS